MDAVLCSTSVESGLPFRVQRHLNTVVPIRSASNPLASQDIRKMKETNPEMYAVFAADDDYAPMLVVPASDADHAIDRARRLRAAFPRLQLSLPSTCRRADPRLDLGWPGIGIVPESILAAIEASEPREQEDPPKHPSVTFERRQRGSTR